MRAKIAIVALLLLAAAGLGFAAYGVEKTEFVAKCLHNGRDYKPCACTYNALPDLPDAYADLAVAWAHDAHDDYLTTYAKTVIKDVLPFSSGRTRPYGIPVPSKDQPYWRRAIKKVGSSVAVKWLVSLLPGVDGGTSIVVTQATRASGNFGYARYVFDQHCDKRLETMANELSRMKAAAKDATAQTMDAVGKTVSEGVDSLSRHAKDAARETMDALSKSIGLSGK